MTWDDDGYLISKKKYNENSLIVEFFTKNHGKVTGLIFGATSKKIKSYLLLGNFFKINFNSKNDNRTGYFKVEISKIITPFFLYDNLKLSFLIYSMNLIQILNVENQSNIKIFYLLNNIFDILNNDNWIQNFIYWELKILKELGYYIDFKEYVLNKNINGKNQYIVKSTSNKIIPDFLIKQNQMFSNNKDLYIGLKLVGDFLDKSILKPNNIPFPTSRIRLLNLISNL